MIYTTDELLSEYLKYKLDKDNIRCKFLEDNRIYYNILDSGELHGCYFNILDYTTFLFNKLNSSK